MELSEPNAAVIDVIPFFIAALALIETFRGVNVEACSLGVEYTWPS
jgi:hypothetical protein